MRRELRVSDVVSFSRLLRYEARCGPFDIIHAHSTKAGFLARLLPRRRGAGVIYTPNGLLTANPELGPARRAAVCFLESFLARFCRTVIAVSNREVVEATSAGIGLDKVVLIRNGPAAMNLPDPLKRSRARADLGVCEETVCIGFVGRLAKQKEPLRVIDAFACLKRRTSQQLMLAVVGWGPLEKAMRLRVAERGLSSTDVRFVGQARAVDYIPAFDILVQTSSYEGFPYTFLEAMAGGLPIVTTNVGGVDEVLVHGTTGYVCDPWDCETFAGHLHRVVERPALRAEMGEAARLRASQFNSIDMVASTVQVYTGAQGVGGTSLASCQEPVLVPAESSGGFDTDEYSRPA